MDKQTSPVNPGLNDIFRTVLEQSTPKAPPASNPPSVFVCGNNNVISYGGTVHLTEQDNPLGRRQTR